MFGKKAKEILKLKQMAIISNARIERLELAVDKLASVVGLEWRDKDRAWKPKEKQDNG